MAEPHVTMLFANLKIGPKGSYDATFVLVKATRSSDGAKEGGALNAATDALGMVVDWNVTPSESCDHNWAMYVLLAERLLFAGKGDGVGRANLEEVVFFSDTCCHGNDDVREHAGTKSGKTCGNSFTDAAARRRGSVPAIVTNKSWPTSRRSSRGSL